MTRIIVEIGLNHLGSEERAWRMLKCAGEAGVDAVTFQIREPKFYESPDPLRHRLSAEFYRSALAATKERGQSFGVAIADQSLVSEFAGLGVEFWKMLSWDFPNQSMLGALKETGKPVMMSTGLSSHEDIVKGSASIGDVELIHTQLSQKIEEVNLKAIAEIRRATGKPVAFGLHCANHDVLKMALAFEPTAVLFYIKEEGCTGLFDDEHAVSTESLASFVGNLKSLETALGTGHKGGGEKPAWFAH